MDPDRFRQALRDLSPPGDSLTELVEGWNTQLLAAINEIAPKRPLQPRRNWAPWFTEELRKMKRDLRRLEQVILFWINLAAASIQDEHCENLSLDTNITDSSYPNSCINLFVYTHRSMNTEKKEKYICLRKGNAF
ncbi:Hypothetical predicted protein [Podarcis lilfordi]|uniref:Uncharacterized protein n=1 Tax=Podarcis lilfordi TaxID=74358 RepID=A0AA35PJC4_9SAUR|nr:Hypothetical predicted protein [Podarcis lilfordi]